METMEAPRATILLVDDDAIMLCAVSMLLARHGHKVLQACGPLEALEILRGGGPVDIVISDFRMPGLNGGELLREIAQISPSTMGIIISAGTVHTLEVPSGVPILRKPFPIGDLLAEIDRVWLALMRRR